MRGGTTTPHTHRKQHRAGAGEETGLKTPRRAVAGRKQHPPPLLSWSQVCSGRSRIQAQGPTFAQAAKPKRGWLSSSLGREAPELPALEPASAAHAGVGRELGSKQALVGTAGFRQGVPGRSEQAKRNPGEN